MRCQLQVSSPVSQISCRLLHEIRLPVEQGVTGPPKLAGWPHTHLTLLMGAAAPETRVDYWESLEIARGALAGPCQGTGVPS